MNIQLNFDWKFVPQICGTNVWPKCHIGNFSEMDGMAVPC